MANSYFLLINRKSGKALQATDESNGASVVQHEINNTDAQLWSQTTVKGKGVKLINKAYGKALDIMCCSTENGSLAQIWDDVDGDSQIWKLETASRGFRKLLNTNSAKVLDIKDLSDDCGAFAQLWEDLGGENQEWKLCDYPEKVKPATAKKTTATAKKSPAKTIKNTKEKIAAKAK